MATDAEIAAALSGSLGPVVMRYRFEQRTAVNVYQADITTAIEGCSIDLDNDRPISRTASMTIRASSLPAAFDPDNDHIAVFAELLVNGTYERFQLGLFLLDDVTEIPMPNGQLVWNANGSSLELAVLDKYTVTSFTVAAGERYIDAAIAVLLAAGLATNIAASTLTLPVPHTWPPQTPYGQIVNDLLFGANYFPVYADAMGIMSSRPRLTPSTEIPVVSYSTAAEPRMVRATFERRRTRALYPNRFTVTNHDPTRAPSSIVAVNDDPDSPVSTVVKGIVTSTDIDGSMVPNDATAIAIGSYETQKAATNALAGTLRTHPDPRRGNQEYYEVTIESQEVATLWRVVNWALDCSPGAEMTHGIARASEVDVSAGVLVGTCP